MTGDPRPWTPGERAHLADLRELEIRAAHFDGRPGRWTPIWVVVVGGDVLVRTWQRRETGWYDRAVSAGSATIRLPGGPVDVVVAVTGETDAADVDAAYRAKYAASGAESMVTPEAVASTLRLDALGSHQGPFFHGTKADLKHGDLLTAGFRSNYRPDVVMNHIYFAAVADGAGLAAELAPGDAEPRVYVVEPTGAFEDDPNVTDKRFPGNPTRSYRSTAPLRVIGEATEWTRLTPEARQAWEERLAALRADERGEIIN